MKIHTEGCLDIFSEQIASNIGGVGGVGIGIGLVQVENHISKTDVDVDVGVGVGVGIGLVQVENQISNTGVDNREYHWKYLQLIGMIFAIFLATTIKKQYESV